MQNMKFFFRSNVNLYLMLGVFFITGLSWGQEASPKAAASGKVATVNGVDILKKDLDHEMNRIKQRAMAGNGQESELDPQQLERQALESIIDRELLYQASIKNGVTVSPEQVNSRMDMMKKNFPTEAEFQSALERTGLTEAAVKASIGQMVSIEMYIEKEVKPKVAVSENEIKTFYDQNPNYFKKPEQVHASHILVKVPENGTEKDKSQAMTKIRAAQSRIQKGEDFKTVAQSTSEDPSGPNGGDLGFFSRGQMVKPFEDAAFSLEKGRVSDVVTTRFGYHLIKLIDRTPEGTITLDESKQDIDRFLKEQKLNRAVGQLAMELRKNAKIEMK